MIRVLLIALASALSSLGSGYAVAHFLSARQDAAHDEPARPAVEQKKTRIINVPILARGQVQGYVVAQFLYTAEAKALKETSPAPDAYILDEAFRMIYAEEKLDFSKLDKVDLARLTTQLRERVVKRMNSDVVKDVLVQEFNYVSKDDVRK